MPKIAISYRRADSEAMTGRIFDRLIAHYGKEAIFRDIDDIPPGIDFRVHINQTLLKTHILLAIVGPQWVGMASDGSADRIQEETDPVRVEVETALRRRVPLIPVLIGSTKMPSSDQLPPGLKDFAFRNAVKVDTGQDFDYHMDRLIRSMDAILEQEPKSSPSCETKPPAAPKSSTPGRQPEPAAEAPRKKDTGGRSSAPRGKRQGGRRRHAGFVHVGDAGRGRLARRAMAGKPARPDAAARHCGRGRGAGGRRCGCRPPRQLRQFRPAAANIGGTCRRGERGGVFTRQPDAGLRQHRQVGQGLGCRRRPVVADTRRRVRRGDVGCVHAERQAHRLGHIRSVRQCLGQQFRPIAAFGTHRHGRFVEQGAVGVVHCDFTRWHARRRRQRRLECPASEPGDRRAARSLQNP